MFQLLFDCNSLKIWHCFAHYCISQGYIKNYFYFVAVYKGNKIRFWVICKQKGKKLWKCFEVGSENQHLMVADLMAIGVLKDMLMSSLWFLLKRYLFTQFSFFLGSLLKHTRNQKDIHLLYREKKKKDKINYLNVDSLLLLNAIFLLFGLQQ